MRYKYRAIKSDGERYDGISEAKSKLVLYNELKNQGEMLISAEEIRKRSLASLFTNYFGLWQNISLVQKISFAKNLAAMINAGLSLSRSLSVISRQSQNNKFKNIIEGLNQEIKKGKTLSESFRIYPNIFSNLFVSMTKAGEESGSLAEALSNVALQMDKTYRLQKKIKGALIYPAVIISVMIIIGILMFIFVVPGIIATFSELNTELPLSTKLIIFISNFLSNNWLIFILGIIIFIFLIYYCLKTVLGKNILDRVVVRLPLISNLVCGANTARVARTLSSLLKAGVPVAQSIQITEETINNHLFKQVLSGSIKAVESGGNISAVFLKNQKYYPVFMGEMIAVGEETGNIAAMLMEVAIFYENDIEEKTKDLSTIIEPILMVIIGVAVGFFALSMITPIYSVMDKI